MIDQHARRDSATAASRRSSPRQHDSRGGKYVRFMAMISTSTAVMFALTYVNSYELSHVQWSETRAYMALIMGAAMAVVMLSFMLDMYQDWRKNLAIVAGSVALFTLAFFLVRSQATVQDESWMRGMIPHHSIAILTSERADISDLRVAELAGEIVDAQRHEIAEMEWLLNDIDRNGPATSAEDAAARPIPDFGSNE